MKPGWSVLLLSVVVACFEAVADEVPSPSREVHAFYYTWYGNPQTDGAWRHWDHEVILRKGGGAHHQPPEDIGANFYPEMGLYSSNDGADVTRHMTQMHDAGAGVVAVTWWGRDDYSDKALETVFAAAAQCNMQVCFHIEPFPGRSAGTTRDALVYLLDRYGDHPALYRDLAHGNRTMVYLYDSYLTPAAEWGTVFGKSGEQTIRGTRYDVLAIGLWVKAADGPSLVRAGFDGFYTYFATDGFTYGSTLENWPALRAYARDNGLLFVPSVGPGYCDTRIRPWNDANTRSRETGAYYDRAFAAALAASPDFISITSFNEWHEGTQIEPAVPKRTEAFTYLDYEGLPPSYYLERTAYWVRRWKVEH